MQSADKRTAGSSRLRARRGSKTSHTTSTTAAATTAHAHGHAHSRGASQRRRRACCSGRVVVLCMLAAVCVGLLSRWLLLHALPPATDTPTVDDTAALRHALTQAQHSLHTHMQQQQQQQQSAHHIRDGSMQHTTRSLWRTLEQLAAAMLRVAGALDVYLQRQASKVASNGVTYDDSGAAELDATTVAAAELLHEAAALCYRVVHDTHPPPLPPHHSQQQQQQQQQQQHHNVTRARTSDPQPSLPPPPYALAWQRVWAAAAFAYGTALPEYHLLRDEVDEHVRVLLRLVHVLLLSTDCRDDDDDGNVSRHSSHTASISSSIRGAHDDRSAGWWAWLLHVLHLRRGRASAPPHVRAHCRLLAGQGEHGNNNNDSDNNATQWMRHHGNDAAAMTWQRFCASSLHNCVAVDTRIAAALEELIALRPRTHAFRAHYAAHYVLRYARARLASRDDGAHDTHARRQAAATALRLLRSDRTRLHNANNTTRTTTAAAQAQANASRTRDDVAVHRGLLDVLEAYVLVAVADAASTRVLHDNTTDAQHWRRSVVALITRAARTLGNCTRLTHATRHIHSHHNKSTSTSSNDDDKDDDGSDMAAVLYWPPSSAAAAAEDAGGVWRREWQPPLLTSRAATRRLVHLLYRFVAQHAVDDDGRAATLAFLRSCVVA